jgi:peroxiredoxin
MRFPDFTLERAGGGTLSLADLEGQPWIGYLSRHPG